MTTAVYIIGGAGTGKSTFTAEVLDGLTLGPLEDLAQKPNARGTIITLRGHRWDGGVYLGVMRPSFPGSDGLDRASSIVGEVWADAGNLPPAILCEGKTLATRRFLAALHRNTYLKVFHLMASEEERQRRFAERGSNQDPSFVKATATQARSTADWLRAEGAVVYPVNTEDPDEWATAADMAWLLIRR